MKTKYCTLIVAIQYNLCVKDLHNIICIIFYLEEHLDKCIAHMLSMFDINQLILGLLFEQVVY